MKSQKTIPFAGILCLAIGILSICFIAPVSKFSISDLHFRHNEISCSHTGVNPFLIWNHQIQSDTYQALERPDKNLHWKSNASDARPVSSKLRVHAYPAWHTTFFWFYGWLSQKQCDLLMYLLFSAIGIGFFFYLKRWQPKTRTEKLLYWGMPVMMLRGPFMECFYYGNYGFILLLFSVLMYESLVRGKQIYAGLSWAIMMIKPNVSILFFWPLLFQKKYVAIGVAIAICLLATLWPAYVYNCSPTELILQISEQGLAYIPRNSPPGIAFRLLGINGIRLWMGGWFVFCGVLSYCLRKVPSWMVRLLPALVLASIWTYSKEYDRMILWFFYFVVVQQLLNRGPLVLNKLQTNVLWGYVTFCIGAASISTAWESSTKWHWLTPGRMEWFPRLLSYMNLFFALCVLVMFAWTAVRHPSKNDPNWQDVTF